MLLGLQLHLTEATAKNTSVGSIFHLSWRKKTTSADTSHATRTIHSCSSSSSTNKATTLLPKNVPYICKVPAQETKGPLIHSLHWPATFFGPPRASKNFRRYGTTARPGELCESAFFFLSLPTARGTSSWPPSLPLSRGKYDRSHSSEPLEFICSIV